MIKRFNRSMILKAVMAFTVGGACLALTFFAFLELAGFVAGCLGWPWLPLVRYAVALGAAAIVFGLGWRHRRKVGGLVPYAESGIYDSFQPGTMGAQIAWLNRMAAASYVLGQVLLSGPLGILRGRDLLAARISPTAEHEATLNHVLSSLRTARKWQDLQAWSAQEPEIRQLVRMALVDISSHNGRTRIKAVPAGEPEPFTHPA